MAASVRVVTSVTLWVRSPLWAMLSTVSCKFGEKNGDRGTKHAAAREDREKPSPVRVYLIPTTRSCRHMARG